MHYMLDTDICSYIIRNQPEELLRKYKETVEFGENFVCISSIVASELIYGTLLKPSVYAIVHGFIDEIDVLPWDKEVAYHYADIRTSLKKNGTPVAIHDMQIAAHARSIGAIIVTNNNKHFKDIPGIITQNWV